MDKQSFRASGLIEKYMLGLTTEAEDRIVERFMESDPDIKTQIFEGQYSLYERSKAYAKPAPLGSKKAIFDQINALEKEEQQNTNKSSSISLWLQYAAIGLLAVSTFYFWNSNQSLNQTNGALSAQLEECSDSFAAIDTEKATLTSNEYILTHSATERVQLKGTNLSPEASMLAFYNPKAEVLMIKIDELPPPPDGKYYHMWADVDGEMIHVGSLSNDAVSLTSLSFVSQAASLNVTIENLPDVDHPDVSQLALSGNL